MANKSQAEKATSSAGRGSGKKSTSNSKSNSSAPKQNTSAKKNVKKPQSNTSSTKSKREAFEKQIRAEQQTRRTWLGIIFIVLAFICFLSWFNTDTAILKPMAAVVIGLFGQMGKFLLPFLLVYNALILFSNYGHPVRMRLWCGFFTLIFLCGLIHCIADFFGKHDNTLNIVTLWKNAFEWKSGGVIPGFIAQLMTKCITRVGAMIAMGVIGILCALATRSITPVGVVKAIGKRKPEPVKEEREDASERFVERIVSVRQEKKIRRISPGAYDVDVDDPPLLQQEPQEKRTGREEDHHAERPDRKEQTHRGRIPYGYDMEERQMTMDEVELHEPQESRRPVKVVEKSDSYVTPVQKDASPDGAEKDNHPKVDLFFDEPAPIPAVSEDVTPIPVKEERPAEHVVPPLFTPPQKPTEKVTKEDATMNAAMISAEIAEQEPVPVEYVFPSIDLLNRASGGSVDATAEMRGNSKRLADALQSFGVTPHIVDVIRGPSVTRYELELDPGVKLSKITNLSEDIALALGAQGVRISAIPDKISVVGIEVPNKVVNTVYAREVIGSTQFTDKKSKVSFAVGKDISGACIVGDIGKMPHMLIAGTTGSGKSVCMNTLIISLLYKAKPDEVKLIMVDPKMVELGIYNGIPH